MVQDFKVNNTLFQRLTKECVNSNKQHIIVRDKKNNGFSIYYSKNIKKWVAFIIGAVMSHGVVINIFDNLLEASEYVESNGISDGKNNLQFRYPRGWEKRGQLNYYLDPIFDNDLPSKNNQLKKLLLLLI